MGIALLLALTLDVIDNPNAPPCLLEAKLHYLAPYSPAGTVKVAYLTEACGWQPPVFKAETVTVEESIEDSDTEEPADYRCVQQEPHTGPKDPCEDHCPCLIWYAHVYGKPGRHFIQVWGPDGEGYDDLVIDLSRLTPDGKYRKMTGE